MAYDEALAERVRDLIAPFGEHTEKKMFGGLAFMQGAGMIAGVMDDRLVLRLGLVRTAEALKRPHTHPMDFTGKVIRTMLYVEPEGLRGRALSSWITRAREAMEADPPKKTR